MMLNLLANKTLIEQAIAAYELKAKELLPQQSGYRNINQPFITKEGQAYNLIIYKNEPGIVKKIKTANAVGLHLHGAGLPARYPLTNKILKIKSERHTKYACLYNYLPGHTIPWEGYTKKHLKALGENLQAVHQSLKTTNLVEVKSTAIIYAEILKSASEYFESTNVKKAMKKKLNCQLNSNKLNQLRAMVRRLDKLPHQQPLHMDLVRGNVLFCEQPIRICGLIDFEKSSYGHPYFDIARSLSFLLVDCKYKPPQEVEKYFLCKGYFNKNTNIPKITVNLSEQKINLLDTLVNCFLIYDLYKFLKHNPYEFLGLNEHYIRTRDLLVKKNLVVKTT
jgi:Ser/Thr protein kinase RdoA (MazF antagonist)